MDTEKHAATLTKGSPGVLHGSMSYLIQDDDGQIIDPHSISAGLDYPGVGPEHAFLKDMARAEYIAVTDDAVRSRPATSARLLLLWLCACLCVARPPASALGVYPPLFRSCAWLCAACPPRHGASHQGRPTGIRQSAWLLAFLDAWVCVAVVERSCCGLRHVEAKSWKRSWRMHACMHWALSTAQLHAMQ